MKQRLIKKYEIGSIFFIFGLASFLHYVYDLTNGSIVSIIFGAVNESVWEHMKIFIIAYIVWAVIELLCLKPPFKQYVVAKVIGLVFLSAAIPIGFYIYTFFTKQSIVFVDIALVIVWVIVAAFISYKLTVSEIDLKPYYHISLLILLLYVVMVFCFTVFPPKLELFRDPITGLYGVIPDYIDTGAIILDNMYT